MMHCAHYDIKIEGEPYTREGEAFCCERSYRAVRRFAEIVAAREDAYLDAAGTLIRALAVETGRAAGQEAFA